MSSHLLPPTSPPAAAAARRRPESVATPARRHAAASSLSLSPARRSERLEALSHDVTMPAANRSTRNLEELERAQRAAMLRHPDLAREPEDWRRAGYAETLPLHLLIPETPRRTAARTADEDGEEKKVEPAASYAPLVWHDPEGRDAEIERAQQRWNDLLAESSAAELPEANQLVFLDVEIHKMTTPKHICQFCAVSWDPSSRRASPPGPGAAAICMNEYVWYKPLAVPWIELVAQGFVELAPWNDRARAKPFADVFLAFANQLDDEALVLFKGSTDVQTIRETLHQSPADEAVRVLRAKRVRFVSVDAVWKEVCTTFLPPEATAAFLTAHGSAGRALHQAYEAAFWKPVLVHVDPHRETESIVKIPAFPGVASCPLLSPSHFGAVQCEFFVARHYEPVWHTAHSDTLCTRNLTLFLVHWAWQRSAWFHMLGTLQWKHTAAANAGPTLDRDTLAFHLLATQVVEQTHFFRHKHLTLAPEAARVFGALCRKAESQALEPPQKERAAVRRSLSFSLVPPPSPPPPAAPSSENSAAAARKREERHDDDDGGEEQEEQQQEEEANEDDAEENEEEEEDLEGVLPPAVADTAVQQARVRRAREPSWASIPTQVHGTQATEAVGVYRPRERGADAIKVRALRTLLRLNDADKGSRFQDLIDRHRAAPAERRDLNGRPWFYYPAATGTQAPQVQVLHTRFCGSRVDQDHPHYALHDPPRASDRVAMYDFAHLSPAAGGVIGYTLRFCKECVQWAEEDNRDGDHSEPRRGSPPEAGDDDDGDDAKAHSSEPREPDGANPERRQPHAAIDLTEPEEDLAHALEQRLAISSHNVFLDVPYVVVGNPTPVPQAMLDRLARLHPPTQAWLREHRRAGLKLVEQRDDAARAGAGAGAGAAVSARTPVVLLVSRGWLLLRSAREIQDAFGELQGRTAVALIVGRREPEREPLQWKPYMAEWVRLIRSGVGSRLQAVLLLEWCGSGTPQFLFRADYALNRESEQVFLQWFRQHREEWLHE